MVKIINKVRRSSWGLLFFVNSKIENLFWVVGCFFEEKLFKAQKDFEKDQ